MKINSKLFESLKLNDKEAKNLVGGGDYTLKADDTSVRGGQYDVVFDTLDKSGGSTGWDTENTGTNTKDKPTVIGISPLQP
ncbi:hypothetical protein [Flavobacterium suzhouense]|uniref:Uncharacterized protein n=1 Tax=Flavobacterium suzhouense TaxID=1529638 RepID=A0ABW5NU03_9FLAO